MECTHEWTAPVIAYKPVYNDFNVPISGANYPVAVVSCTKCGEMKKMDNL